MDGLASGLRLTCHSIPRSVICPEPDNSRRAFVPMMPRSAVRSHSVPGGPPPHGGEPYGVPPQPEPAGWFAGTAAGTVSVPVLLVGVAEMIGPNRARYEIVWFAVALNALTMTRRK